MILRKRILPVYSILCATHMIKRVRGCDTLLGLFTIRKMFQFQPKPENPASTLPSLGKIVLYTPLQSEAGTGPRNASQCRSHTMEQRYRGVKRNTD